LSVVFKIVFRGFNSKLVDAEFGAEKLEDYSGLVCSTPSLSSMYLLYKKCSTVRIEDRTHGNSSVISLCHCDWFVRIQRNTRFAIKVRAADAVLFCVFGNPGNGVYV